MLVEEYRIISEISFNEMKKIWKRLKHLAIIIGGWASHFLINDKFYEWKKIHYIGSRDIDFGIRARDLGKVSQRLKALGYKPLNFRFYKIFDRITKKQISEEIASKKPLHEIFYLYVDLLLDEKVAKNVTFFSDPLLKFSFDNALFIEIDEFKIIRAEPLVLLKLRCLKEMDKEKRIKDMLDILLTVNLADFDLQLFRELSDLFSFDKNYARKMLDIADHELSTLRLEAHEIQSIKTTFSSLLEQV